MAHTHTRRKKRRYGGIWAYKNTIGLVLSIIVFILIADTEIVQALFGHMRGLGHMGAAIAGLLFVSTFTFVPATALLFHLAEEFNPFTIALAASFGAVAGDLLIYRFFKGSFIKELAPLFTKRGARNICVLACSPHFAWLTPVLGAAIIALPFLPDELGIGLMGLSKVKQWQFALMAYVLNFLGILSVVFAAALI